LPLGFARGIKRKDAPTRRAEPSDRLLEEIVALLEDYAPSWYPQDLRDRAKRQAGENGGSGLALLSELQELLQQYAPVWYTKQLHDKLAAALRHFRESGSSQKRSR